MMSCAFLRMEAQEYSTLFEAEIDSIISGFYKAGHFNGSVLIAKQGEKVYQKAWGYSDLENMNPLDSMSQYYIASVSKIFTAAAIVLLDMQGRLSVRDKVTKYLPELPGCFRSVRLHHLLSHTAGIPAESWDWRDKVNSDNSLVMEFLLEQVELEFEPGTKYSYSNTGYVLLAMVVERASDKTIDAFLKQNLFDVAGMGHSFVCSRDLDIDVSHVVKSYVNGSQADWPLYIVGPSGIYTTINDLFLWDRAFFRNEIFNKKEVKKILTPVQINGKDQNYGRLGWGVLNINGESYAGHMGGMFGFRTLYEHQVNQDATLIIFSNIGDLTPMMEIRNKLTELISGYQNNKQ